MKKSMIATAVVATAGLAASANAGWFDVTSASYSNGAPTSLTVDDLTANGNSITGMTIDNSNTAKALSTTSASAILTALSAGGRTVNNNELYYFGFDSGGGPRAFFGFVYRAGSSASIGWNMASTGNSGVYHGVYDGSSVDTTGLTYNTGSKTSAAAALGVTAGDYVIVMMAGLDTGNAVSGSFDASPAFSIDYLSWGGSAFTSVTSATGAFASQLNVSTYAVPVPAPALLAGAGLVGAAALRRRMAKKA